MKIGLVGLPLTGKTTVFNLLTGRAEDTAGGKREAHLATIKVPDSRVERLAAIFQPKKATHAEIEFVDLPGFEAGRGGLESARLNEMRNLDALVHVLRLFESATVPRHECCRGAEADARSLEQELILTDLVLVERRVERLRSDIGKGRKELAPELALMERLRGLLEEETPLRAVELSETEAVLLRGYQLVSRLPVILLANTGGTPDTDALADLAGPVEAGGLGLLAMNAQAEWEIEQLPESERAEFLADLGVSEPARDRFIRAGYDLLHLISFFTVGDDELRAWTLERGGTALRAAGKIHSDMERGFIRAEVIACEEFLALGSMAAARKAGALRLEGRDYEVADGDILTIRFSV
ncbi:MAG: redox-regulated ATPase YchF [Candidatus Krumholzibacteriota bacterium]|nr:redox-regulated ATPase YchF [Candidatus Krumholzibacteriota bacterium]